MLREAHAHPPTPPSPPLPQDWIPVKDNGAIAGAAAKEVTKALEDMGSDGHLATTDTASAQGALTFIRVGVAGERRGMQGKRGTAATHPAAAAVFTAAAACTSAATNLLHLPATRPTPCRTTPTAWTSPRSGLWAATAGRTT